MHLLDVNFLIALHDSFHQDHELAQEWFKSKSKLGWATCPITELGFIRITSHRNYPRPVASPSVALESLEATKKGSAKYLFWSDDLPLRNAVAPKQIIGASALTDLYLLSLAVKRRGKLVTFDRKINFKNVPKALAGDILVVSA